MDKYQEYILHTLQKPMGTIYAYADNSSITLDNGLFDNKLIKVDIDEKIVIKQNEDITITKYQLVLVHEGIEAIYAVKQNEHFPFNCVITEYHWSGEKTNKDRKVFYYELNFDNKIDSIKIVFKDRVAEDLIVPIEFLDADKEAYYAKKEAERIAKLRWKAAISHATGLNLVNIYFQPCSENYAKTEIILYHGNKLMMAKYIVEGEQYFKAITDLACNNYSFVLKQLSADGEIFFETDPIDFSIKYPVIETRSSNVRYRQRNLI